MDPYREFSVVLWILMGIGVVAALCSARGAVLEARRLRDPLRVCALMLGFRRVVVALVVAAVAASLIWELENLLVLALIIGAEELLESSAVIAAIRSGSRTSRSSSSAGSLNVAHQVAAG